MSFSGFFVRMIVNGILNRFKDGEYKFDHKSKNTYTVEISNGQFGDVIASKQVTFKDIGYHTVWLDDPVSVSEFTVVVRSTGGIMVEGSSTDIFLSKAGADNGLPITENAEYMITPTQGRSFVKIDGQWVDMTDDSTKQYVRSNICPNDPFITVMYK